MNLGLGVDIVSVPRIRKALKNKKFKDKIFTAKEISYCQSRKSPEIYFAARFAAKEAVIKALAGKLRKIDWKEIEVAHNRDSSPKINLDSKVKKKLKNPKILITLSHTHEFAVAVAYLIKT
ncbi:MAG TPA: holo-ACP synthase [candidate division Zixibacteria bacterium]|nr:holo-ACP synthase [candidate division Zixibacteria bacterium]